MEAESDSGRWKGYVAVDEDGKEIEPVSTSVHNFASVSAY